MISPLVRQSFLLSSRTVFMFSIHTASTGPSNTYHFLSLVVLELPTRIMDDKMPSVLKTENIKVNRPANPKQWHCAEMHLISSTRCCKKHGRVVLQIAGIGWRGKCDERLITTSRYQRSTELLSSYSIFRLQSTCFSLGANFICPGKSFGRILDVFD